MANAKAAAIAEALQRLQRALFEGQQQYFERSSDGGRQGVKTQLVAIEEFITTVIQPSPTAPLRALLSQLTDLDVGAVGPLLGHERFSGRAPDSMARDVTKLYASLTVQELLDLGFRLEDSVKEVTKVLIECGVPFAGRNPDERKVVKQWRYELNKLCQREPQDPKVIAYRNMLAGQRVVTEQMRGEIEKAPVGDRALVRNKFRNRSLLLLAAGIMRDGEGISAADAVNARWKVASAQSAIRTQPAKGAAPEDQSE